MNPTDEQSLSQRLHEEIGSLTVPPAPSGAVRRRGRAIKTRRRVYAAGVAALAVAVAAVSVQALTGAARVTPPPSLTKGGVVFASGVTNGKRWQLAVRNISAHPGTHWCLPAVMLNGHTGTVLTPASRASQSGLQGLGLASAIPGLPGVAFGFIRVSPGVTKVAYHLPGLRPAERRPVAVAACGQRFLLTGFAYTKGGEGTITTYARHRHRFGPFPMAGSAGPHERGNAADIWNLIPQQVNSRPIASGRVGHTPWTITETLSTVGQGYTVSTGGIKPQRASLFGFIEAPPQGSVVSRVPFPPALAHLITGYAALVNPRTAYAVASLSNGTSRRLVPVDVAGRVYVALAVPRGVRLIRLTLHDTAGSPLGAPPPAP